MKFKKRKFWYRRCKNCEVLRALSITEKESGQEEYLSRFTSPESIIQEMNKLHDTFISVIQNQKYLIFWGEVTKRYSNLLSKYHMEFSTVSPKNFWFESSLTEEVCNGLTELGLLERRTENEKSTKN